MAATSRLVVSVLVVIALAWLAGPGLAQDDQPADRERLQQEQAQQLRQLAQQQDMPPGAQHVVIGIGGDGMGQARRIGPPEPEMVPAQMYPGAGCIYVVRGYMLHQFSTGGVLEQIAQADLRTSDEQAAPQPPEGGRMLLSPDPAMVPVSVEFNPDKTMLFVLRGYVLHQFSAEGLTQVAEFDLRSEDERNRPRVQMRMMMGPGGPRGDGPPPPLGDGPPPPPDDGPLAPPQ